MIQRLLIGSTILLMAAVCPAAEPAVDGHWIAPPPEALKTFAAVLPQGWSCRQEQDSLVARPRDELAFVNLINAAARDGESEEEYLNKHRVRFDYRIVLRFQPLLTSEHVRQIVDENAAARRRLDLLARGRLVIPAKDVQFLDSSQGKAAAREYARLLQSIRPVPDGTLHETSVYLETTDLGYARFRHEETEQQCLAVRKLLIDQIVPFERAAPGKQSVDK
ncbi:MAG TPA: hypothetical protein VGG30_03460 [Pirellulales bacterium]|jgi:hypothetical protein